MKKVVLLISSRKQANASGFIEEFTKLNGKIDKIICLHVKHNLLYYIKKGLKIVRFFSPAKLKHYMVKCIRVATGMQEFKDLKLAWEARGENSWDLLPDGMDIFDYANKNKIPLEFVSGLTTSLIEANTKESALFVLYTGGILSKEILEIKNAEFLNAHMGEMPVYRGMNVIEWAVLEGKSPKVTVMVMNKQIDGGDIVCMEAIPLNKEETIAELRKTGYICCYKTMAKGVYNYQRNESLRLKQPVGAKYYYKMHPILRKMLSNKLPISTH